jgi:tetratricopeptide (TPR) repeat protein
MKHKANTTNESLDGWQLLEAEAQYADSIFRNALGDVDASIAAARRAVEIKPDYAPAFLTLCSIEYQLGREAEGRLLFHSLLTLPDQTEDVWEVIDAAGDFLIQNQRYADAMELYEGAVQDFRISPSYSKASLAAQATKGCLIKLSSRRKRRCSLNPVVRI